MLENEEVTKYAEVVAKEVRRPSVEPGTIRIDETTFSTPLQGEPSFNVRTLEPRAETSAWVRVALFAFLILAVCVAGWYGMGLFEVNVNGGRW